MSETMFRSHTGINDDGRVNYGEDSRQHVVFYKGRELHGLQSSEQGRPIYVGVDMCRIRQPGERDEWHGKADMDKQMRFPKQWEAYQNNQEYVPDGTPLSVVFGSEPETVENLKFFKIFTVEQLANLQEAGVARIGMGGRNLQIKAQKFMEKATGYQSVTRMDREMTDLKSENDLLKERLAALEKLVTAPDDKPGKKGT